jgi:hypothetical protein
MSSLLVGFAALPLLLGCGNAKEQLDVVEDDDADLATSRIGAGGYAATVFIPSDSGAIDVTKAPYHAIPDDGLDDTAALRNAIKDAVNSRPNTVYLPAGTFNVRDNLTQGAFIKRVTLQGAGRDRTIIRLSDNAPGFMDSTVQKDVISFYDGSSSSQDSYRNHVRDLTFDIGSGNAGAVALRFHSNNEGAVRNVLFKSSDPGRKGHTGLRVTRAFPGPLILENVEVVGFERGIEVMFDRHSVTMHKISLKNQLQYGLKVTTNTASISDLYSENTVPALIASYNQGAGGGSFVTLIRATLKSSGGADGIVNEPGSSILVSNVSNQGYTNAFRDAAAGVTSNATHVDVYATGVATLPDSSFLPRTLPSPPKEVSFRAADFIAVASNTTNDSTALRDAMAFGKKVIYFPRVSNKKWSLTGAIVIPTTVEMILGMENVFDVTGATFETSPNRSRPLLMERFENLPRFVMKHPGTYVIRDSFAQGFENAAGVSGNLYVHNVTANNWTFRAGLTAVLRQVNPEPKSTSDWSIRNEGANVWILGIKTEGVRTVVSTSQNGLTGVLGGYLLPSSSVPQEPAFIVDHARLFVRYTNAPNVYPVQIRHVDNGTTTDTRAQSATAFRSGRAVFGSTSQ